MNKINYIETKNLKKKDGWDKFQMIATLISSLLIAFVGASFTFFYNKHESEHKAQTDSAQRRNYEVQLITNLIPLLASEDSNVKNIATLALQAMGDSNTIKAISIKNRDISKDLWPLDKFIGMIYSSKISKQEKVDKLEQLGEMAVDTTISAKRRLEVRQAITGLISSPDVAQEISKKALSISNKIYKKNSSDSKNEDNKKGQLHRSWENVI